MPDNVFIKDSAAVLDYQIDWSEWLDGDTISTSEWTVPSGITEDSDANTTTTATVWLSGGTVGQEYRIVNRVVTAGGRTDERYIRIKVVEHKG